MHRIRKSSEGSDLKATTTNLFHSAIRLGEREMLVGSHSSLYLYAQACIFGFLWKKQIFSSTDAHFQYWWVNRETSCPYRPWKSSNCKSLQIIYARKWREYFSFLPKACTPEITPISLLLWGIIQSFFFFFYGCPKSDLREREREYWAGAIEWQRKSSLSLHIEVVFSISGFEGLRKNTKRDPVFCAAL